MFQIRTFALRGRTRSIGLMHTKGFEAQIAESTTFVKTAKHK